MISLPPGTALSIQYRTNLVAVLGERVTVIDPESGDVVWERPAPAGARQVQFAINAPRLYVATEHGDLITLDAASGDELSRHPFGPGRFWVARSVGPVTILREAGEILSWSGEGAPETLYQTGRPILRPVQGNMMLEQSTDGPVLVMIEYGDGRIAPLRGFDALTGALGGGALVLDRPDEGAQRRLRQVYPGTDGGLYWRDEYTLDLDGPVRGMTCAGDPEWLYVICPGGVQVWRLPEKRRSPLAPPFTDKNPCPASEVPAAKRVAEMVTPDPVTAVGSSDGRWLAATGPKGGTMVVLKALLNPRAKKPKLEHLRGLPAVVGAVCRWKYPASEVDEVVRSALYDQLIDRDWLAGAPPEVRAWGVTAHLEHFLSWDGLTVTVDKCPDHVRLAAACYDALDLPDVANAYRDAEPWIPRYEEGEEGATEALDAIEARITRASRKAPARRLAWLITHQAAFAAL